MGLNIMVLLNLFSDELQDEAAEPDASSNNSLGGVDYRNFETSNFTLAEADLANPQISCLYPLTVFQTSQVAG